MNRPRIVGILSAMIGSTAGFLVLHRWRLAGTITGAAAMPLIYTLVTHCSHASIESLRGWLHRRVRKGAGAAPEGSSSGESATEHVAGQPEPEATITAGPPAPRSARTAGRGLQWSAATLAFLAFAASVYSLAHLDAGTTILRERVVETVTVTTDRPSLSFASGGSSDVAAATGLLTGQDASTTTTATVDDTSATTVSTVAGSDGTTTTTAVQ